MVWFAFRFSSAVPQPHFGTVPQPHFGTERDAARTRRWRFSHHANKTRQHSFSSAPFPPQTHPFVVQTNCLGAGCVQLHLGERESTQVSPPR